VVLTVLCTTPQPPGPTLFPYTTLFRSIYAGGRAARRVPGGIGYRSRGGADFRRTGRLGPWSSVAPGPSPGRSGRGRGRARVDGMKQTLEVLGFLAVVQGLAGLVSEFTDWHWGVVQRVGFLDGYELYASLALLVLGGALFAAAESRASG